MQAPGGKNGAGLVSAGNMVNPKVLKVVRIVLAAVICYSVVYRCIYSWNTDISPLLYFTIQTNIGCGLFWLLGSLFPKLRTPGLSFLVTTYIAITGVVFILLLDYGFLERIYAKLAAGEISDIVHYYSMVVSMICHYLVPLLAVVDFLVFTDARRVRHSLWVFLYPLCYCAFALVYGLATGKYVYPFLDPDFMGGWGMVALVAAGILLIIFLVSRALWHLNKKVQERTEHYYRAILGGEMAPGGGVKNKTPEIG